jgi:HEAT repeat protein
MDKPETWNGVVVPHGHPLTELAHQIESGSAEVRWAAFRALVSNGEDGALDLLALHATASDPHFRRAAIESIGLHERGHELASTVLAALVDKSPYVVRSACEAAARIHLVGSHDQVVALLGSTDPMTQVAALRALEVLWQPRSFEPVYQLFVQSRAPEVRKQAAFALRKNADAESAEILFDLWKADSLPRHRQWACEVAQFSRSAEMLPGLQRLANDPDGHVRRAAERAIEVCEHAG